MLKVFQAGLISAFLLATFVIASAQAPPIPTDPSLKFQGLDGKVYDLAEQRGNVVLVSFGATWCAPCTTELRALGQIQTEYRDKPVKFFWVSIEPRADVSNGQLKQYAKERNVPFSVLRDDAQMVFSQFSPRVRLPLIVMIGKDGKVDAPVKFGMQSQVDVYKADIRARLNKLLARPSPIGRESEVEGAKRAQNH
jgi:peroxiredoxin